MSNDLGTIMQMHDLTASDKAILWSNYQKAMVSNRDVIYGVYEKDVCRRYNIVQVPW